MTASSHRESAKIYMFPTGVQATSAEAVKKALFAAETAAIRASDAVISGNWYHDEAIQAAANPSAKH